MVTYKVEKTEYPNHKQVEYDGQLCWAYQIYMVVYDKTKSGQPIVACMTPGLEYPQVKLFETQWPQLRQIGVEPNDIKPGFTAYVDAWAIYEDGKDNEKGNPHRDFVAFWLDPNKPAPAVGADKTTLKWLRAIYAKIEDVERRLDSNGVPAAKQLPAENQHYTSDLDTEQQEVTEKTVHTSGLADYSFKPSAQSEGLIRNLIQIYALLRAAQDELTMADFKEAFNNAANSKTAMPVDQLAEVIDSSWSPDKNSWAPMSKACVHYMMLRKQNVPKTTALTHARTTYYQEVTSSN